MKSKDYDIWLKKFNPISNENDNFPKIFETHGSDLKLINILPNENVWTLIYDDGKSYISPGRHIMNRMNYFVCQNKWEINQRDYKC